jgi:hypothetical protein
MRIDYHKLKIGDVVLTGGLSLFSYGIRWVTSGFKNRHNKNKATHVGIVVEWEGEKFIMEMLSGGLTLSPFSRYTEESKRRWIIGIVRTPIHDILRKDINRNLVRWYRRKCEKKYDWRGVLAFIGGKGHRKNKWFCSELAAYMWKEFGHVYTILKPEQISPIQFDPRSEKALKNIEFVEDVIIR